MYARFDIAGDHWGAWHIMRGRDIINDAVTRCGLNIAKRMLPVFSHKKPPHFPVCKNCLRSSKKGRKA